MMEIRKARGQACMIPIPDQQTDYAENRSDGTDLSAANEQKNLLSIADLNITVTGIIYHEQLSLPITPTQKVFLSILNNITKNSRDMSIDLTNEEIAQRSQSLFSYTQVRRHLNELEEHTILYRYEGNGRRQFIIRNEEHFNRRKFLIIFNLQDENGYFVLSDRDSLVFSYLLNNSSFYARAGVGLITDDTAAATISSKLGISRQTLKRAFNNLKNKGLFSYASDKKSKTDSVVRPVNFSVEIANKYSEKVHLEKSELCRKTLEKRYCHDSRNKGRETAPTVAELRAFVQKNLCKKMQRITSKKFGRKTLNQKRSYPQGISNQTGQGSLIKNVTPINKDSNGSSKLNFINAQPTPASSVVNVDISVPDIGKDDLGLRLFVEKNIEPLKSLYPQLNVKKSVCYVVPSFGSSAHLKLNLKPRTTYFLMRINSRNLDGLSEKEISELMKNRRLCLEISQSPGQNPSRILLTRTT
ncbi:hypothetical protein [Succinivibrio dextrinosolvens]|uniref:hypothetical protein n=1 Tax=Succinivibrio dextrinosolvens TaxID=83771 RepID=UPI0019225DC1|nr:hypothetical protein [Succinivibrio dextrinosolvens]